MTTIRTVAALAATLLLAGCSLPWGGGADAYIASPETYRDTANGWEITLPAEWEGNYTVSTAHEGDVAYTRFYTRAAPGGLLLAVATATGEQERVLGTPALRLADRNAYVLYGGTPEPMPADVEALYDTRDEAAATLAASPLAELTTGDNRSGGEPAADADATAEEGASTNSEATNEPATTGSEPIPAAE